MKGLNLIRELIQTRLALDSCEESEEIEFRISQIRDIIEILEAFTENIYYLQPETERKIIYKYFYGLSSEKELSVEYGVNETVIINILFHFIESILEFEPDSEIDS